jgi:hypothetical protein
MQRFLVWLSQARIETSALSSSKKLNGKFHMPDKYLINVESREF